MSMTLLEQMKSSISQQSVGYAAKLLGESPANIDKAVTLAMPAILAAITSAAHTPSGTAGQSVVSRLVSDPVNDGSLLHRLPALYQGTMTAAPVYRLGAQLLQAIFGSRLGKLTQTIAALSGIKPASSALLVNTLAPHILSVLGKRHRLCGDATPHGLVNLLDIEHTAMKAAIPGSILELIPAPAKVSTAEAITATAKTAAKPAATPSAKSGSATKSAPVQSAPATVLKHEPYVKPPLVTKQSYQWSSWLPVIALYGAGAAGLAMFLSSQTQAPTGTIGVAAPAQTKSAEVKTADLKPAAELKPSPVKAPEVRSSEVKVPDVKTPVVRNDEVKNGGVNNTEGKPAEVKSTGAKSSDAKAVDAKASDAKSAVKKTDAPAAPMPTAPVIVAEAVKPAPVLPAPVLPAPAAPVAAKPATVAAAKPEDIAAQANPYKPPVAVIRPLADASKPAEPAKPATPAPQPSSGTTSYFGASAGPVIDTTAKINPDYKPAQPSAQTATAAPSAPPETPAEKPASAPAPVTPPPAGTTNFFGTAPIPADAPAKPNPDYKPAVVATPDPAPAPAKAAGAAAPAAPPAQTTIVVQPPPAKGTTTFFGQTPAVAEAPAKPNPDYKPAPVAAAVVATSPAIPAETPKPAPAAPAAPAPPAPSLATQALSAVKNLIAPAPTRPPGVTNYFGATPPMPEAAARPNPDYVPATPATRDPTPPASTTAAATPAAKPSATGDANAVGLCRASLAKVMKGGRIAFQSAKADLRSSSTALLDRVADAVKSCPGVRLTVEGHTDNTGQAGMNQKLSLARAQTVTGYLTSKGVDAARIAPVGIGSARPVAPNTTVANKARNRRIEFTVDNL